MRLQISQVDLRRVSGLLVLASAVSILLSISASQILLGCALGTCFASRPRLRLPPIWLPLALFLAGTFLSLIFSPNPIHGLPQVKKMYVFSILFVILTTIHDLNFPRRLVLWWSGIATAVAGYGLVQSIVRLYRVQEQHGDVYESYVAHRFTGFMSHVMTFSGEDMVVLLLLIAFLAFAPTVSRWLFMTASGSAILIGAVLLISGARTVWLGVAAGGFWLLWHWKKGVAIIAPALIILLLWFVPGPVHDRFLSLFHPRKDLDSNEFRLICIRTGARMIESHPWLGIGLDETKYHFLDYLPPDTRRPLPPGFYQHLHNVYLQYAAERGVPTMLVMMWLLLQTLHDFQNALKKLRAGRSNERFVLHGSIAVVIGIMVSGLFEVNLGDSEVLTSFLIVVGCGYIAHNVSRNHLSIPNWRSEPMTATMERHA